MPSIAKLYLIVVAAKTRFFSIFSYVLTWLKFLCLVDSFSRRFSTNGVPYVSKSYKNGGAIYIGSNLRMNNGMSANQIGYGNTRCIFRAEEGEIHIGNNVGMSQSAIIASGANVYIGDYCLLGGGVKIYTTDFHSMNYLDRRSASSDFSAMQKKDVRIGNDCFIGAGTMILKGVCIGDRVTIGAGSIVTKDIPSDCIAAGVPCRVIMKQ